MSVVNLQEYKKEKTETVESADWIAELETNKEGAVSSSVNNIFQILSNDKKFENIKYDEFSHMAIIPDGFMTGSLSDEHHFSNVDDDFIFSYIETKYQVKNMRESAYKRAKNLFFHSRGFHPVRDYLNEVNGTWDGTDRVSTLFHDFFAADADDFNKEAAELFLTAMVARVFKPGIKFDFSLDLIGDQGIGKSTFLRKLAHKDEWFTDSISSFEGKEGVISMASGNWLIEISENAATKKSEIEFLRRLLSTQVDQVRLPYEKEVSYFPRQFCFASTANNHNLYTDKTGERRRIPIHCKSRVHAEERYKKLAPLSAMTDLTPEYVDQIWAQVMEALWLPAVEENGGRLDIVLDFTNEAKEAQREKGAEFSQEDPWDELITNYLTMKVPADWLELTESQRLTFIDTGYVGGVRPTELYEQSKITSKMLYSEALHNVCNISDPRHVSRVRAIMQTRYDWDYKRALRVGGAVTTGYIRDENEGPALVSSKKLK